MKIAFVYDRINKFGGAERVLLALHEIWPIAPIYTAVYNPKTAKWAKNLTINNSFLQKFPLAKTTHEIYPWLTPLAFESFNFDNYDIVISITSAEAKGIITKPKTLHVCYCLTPTRYLWSHEKEYQENPGLGLFSSFAKIGSKFIIKNLKKWDKIACQRPDYYIAISENVRKRIKQYYLKDANIIFPPVETEKFKIKSNSTNNNYFLVVSRLVSYKKVDLVIRAFNKLGWNLKIIGIGHELKKLKRITNQNVEFLGELTDEELMRYYQDCQALIFPQEEDFGITAVEAQLAGKPVIAIRRGGALETIIEGVTGEFFDQTTDEDLISVLRKFDAKRYDSGNCRKNAIRFSKENFKNEFKKTIENLWLSYNQ